MWISPLKRTIKVEVANDELQSDIYAVAKYHCETFVAAGYDVQIRQYEDIQVIAMHIEVTNPTLFVDIANLKDVDVIYESFTESTIKLPIFWYAYYDEDGGAIVTWSPYA